MNQSQRTKAKFNATIQTLRETGRKFNLNDVLVDIELAEIAAEKHPNNGSGIEPERYCHCPELIICGKRYPRPLGHDCNYAEARAGLTFEASQLAAERIGDPIGSAALGYQWTAELVRTDGSACVQRGITAVKRH